MIFAELFVGNVLLFAREVGRFENFLAQPLVAAGSRQHAAHQVIAAVSVCEGVQRVIGVDAESVGRNEDRAGRTERDIAPARADRAGADCRCGVVARTGDHFNVLGQAQQLRGFLRERAHDREAFKQFRHLRFGNAANVEHFL